ncbi:MAG: DUF3794 domain-containing protein [Prevotella sp.]|nr:DUF3794 domain-containing protein [Alistipes senegalensis]MCM1358678.1 DUF3794 domain-containing protein [Prevotella sp.]MCM1473839.1 DUF3794 domain-containing protein [Muribaculaceae bacterium]
MNTNSNSCGCQTELIEITGLCNPADTTQVISLTPYWKQMYISESLQIPTQKPDVEQINSIDVSVNILRAEVIKTPRSYDDTGTVPVAQPNLEGRLLSGRKLIIEGQLCQKVVYTALETTQPLHSAHFYVPFSAFIVVPETITFGTVTEDSFNVNFDVNACIEDVTASVIDKRSILKQVTLMLYAVPTQSGC